MRRVVGGGMMNDGVWGNIREGEERKRERRREEGKAG